MKFIILLVLSIPINVFATNFGVLKDRAQNSETFANELLLCHVGISRPDAQDLKFISLTDDIRVVSEKLNPPPHEGSRYIKFFEIALNWSGNPDYNFVIRSHESTNTPAMSASLNIDTLFSGENFETVQLNVNIETFLEIENREFKHNLSGSLYCHHNGDPVCLGNLGSSINTFPYSPEIYFSYSLYCRPQ